MLKLRQIDMQTVQGKSLALACKEAEMREQSYYRCRKEYGDLKVDRARTMKNLKRENARLRQLVADLPLEKQVLADAAGGHLPPPNDASRRPTASGRSTAFRNATPSGSSAGTRHYGCRRGTALLQAAGWQDGQASQHHQKH